MCHFWGARGAEKVQAVGRFWLIFQGKERERRESVPFVPSISGNPTRTRLRTRTHVVLGKPRDKRNIRSIAQVSRKFGVHESGTQIRYTPTPMGSFNL